MHLSFQQVIPFVEFYPVNGSTLQIFNIGPRLYSYSKEFHSSTGIPIGIHWKMSIPERKSSQGIFIRSWNPLTEVKAENGIFLWNTASIYFYLEKSLRPQMLKYVTYEIHNIPVHPS